jgi:hypothetical protein
VSGSLGVADACSTRARLRTDQRLLCGWALKGWHASRGYPAELSCPSCEQQYYGDVAIELARLNVDAIERKTTGGSQSTRQRALALATAKVSLETLVANPEPNPYPPIAPTSVLRATRAPREYGA